MSVLRIGLAAVAAFVAYMVVGGLAFGLIPSLRTEFLKYPAVYRSAEGQKSHMAVGMPGMLLSMVALTVVYAMMYRPGYSVREGVIFGALIGIYAIGSFVLHNYVNLNIGLAITVQQSVAYFVEWLIVGLVISLLYKPAVT
jgi:hypothetical protein